MNMSTDRKDTPITLTWGETSLRDIAFKEYFPAAVKDLSVQKDVVTRFLNFYFGRRVQKGLGVEDLVFAVLSILPQSPYNESIVWADDVYKDDGKAFFLSAEAKLAYDIKTVTNKSNNEQSTEEMKETSQRNCIDNDEDTPNISNDIEDFNLNILFDLDDDNYNIDELSTGDKNTRERDETGRNNEQHSHEPNFDVQDNTVSKETVDEFEIKHNIDEFIKDIPKDIKFIPKPIQKENNILYYGPVENAAFSAWCNNMLSNWDTDSKSRAVLKSFFAVVAFVLMRATTKSYKHLFSSFHSEKFLRLLRHCINCGLKTYSPPHKRCLKGSYRTFRRRDGRTPTMFAKLVILGISNTLNKYMKYVILNGLLNYTADYGFNLIRMLRTVCIETVDGDVTQVMESTLCGETEASWKKVAAFLKEYCTGSSSKEYILSYRWARVLDGRFFKDLSCQQNYELAVILTVFVEKITGDSGVWQSAWVENDELEKYREMGNKLYERFESQEKERRSKTNAGKRGGRNLQQSGTPVDFSEVLRLIEIFKIFK